MENKKIKRKDLRHKVIDFLSKEGNKLAYMRPIDNDGSGFNGVLVEINLYSCFKTDGNELFYIKSPETLKEIHVKKMEFLKDMDGVIRATCVDEDNVIYLYLVCVAPIQMSGEDFENELDSTNPTVLIYVEEEKEFPFMVHVLRKGYLQKAILKSVSKKCTSILKTNNYEGNQYNLHISRYGVDNTNKGSNCIIEITCSTHTSKDNDKSFTVLYRTPLMCGVDLSKKKKV